MVQAGGLEPPTIRLSDGTSNQLKYTCIRRAENYSPPSGVLCQVLVSTNKKNNMNLVRLGGIEPPTGRLKVYCSTN